jgi:hypothetical protein
VRQQAIPWVVALGVALLVGGCGASEVAAVDGGGEKLSGPPAPWESMSFEDRKRYMAKTVLPTMKPLFQAFDAEYYSDFGCATCHGSDAEDTGYTMPNDEIRALYPTGHADQLELVRTEKKTLQFMFGTVVPKMKTLLGAKSYDVATKTGFSCFSCHPAGE